MCQGVINSSEFERFGIDSIRLDVMPAVYRLEMRGVCLYSGACQPLSIEIVNGKYLEVIGNKEIEFHFRNFKLHHTAGTVWLDNSLFELNYSFIADYGKVPVPKPTGRVKLPCVQWTSEPVTRETAVKRICDFQSTLIEFLRELV